MKRIVDRERNTFVWEGLDAFLQIKATDDKEDVLLSVGNCGSFVTFAELEAFADDLKKIAHIRSVEVAARILETEELT